MAALVDRRFRWRSIASGALKKELASAVMPMLAFTNQRRVRQSELEAAEAQHREAEQSLAGVRAGHAEAQSTLAEMGAELVSTGGTAQALTAAGLAVTPVSSLTGYPELLGGRVKTLHPAIAAAVLLVRRRRKGGRAAGEPGPSGPT